VLFPTLIRLELVYAPLFGCSRVPLWQLDGLWRWRQRFHALEGVAASCWPEAWRRDYFGALFPLNPGGIVPAAAPLATLAPADNRKKLPTAASASRRTRPAASTACSTTRR
jgi:putative glutathione S-transferase